MRLVGVDPGKSGYAIGLDTDSNEGFALKLPFDDHGGIDLAFPRWLLEICQGHESLVILEKLNAAGGDKLNKHTCFKMGYGFGQLELAIRATLLPSRIVTPQQWQAEIFEGLDKKLPAKKKAMVSYERLFPGDPIPKRPQQRKIDDNAVDAFWIAQYGALKFGGGRMVIPGRFIHCRA